jgi:anti-anti-sigma factor
MEAKFAVRGEVLIVELNGRLDFETSEPFRKTCMEKLVSEKVVFDLRNLNFVGSLGLTDFVATLDQMSQKSQPGVRFCQRARRPRYLRISRESHFKLQSAGHLAALKLPAQHLNLGQHGFDAFFSREALFFHFLLKTVNLFTLLIQGQADRLIELL